ncbi:arginine repressor [Allosphingosinicella indica]|uniref:Arginine repressor n=1 Tax=Allosphingosinicella indica TaxID=941907 RepID=A0A1X7GVJ8_9SPHN|nr:arginine repressor [Allosphingosinicella indica]SMF75086.1 transcriptional regulator, ArgR family [Allosphingosinicella indica]
MTDARAQRQRAIAAILRTEPVTSQEEVTAKLAERGLSATQATVSRDLDQMGAVKVRRGGVISYALPDQIGESDWAGARLDRIIAEWVIAVEAAGNLIVLRTPPATAHIVALAVDQAKLPEVAGTIAGDDTLFLAVREGVTVDTVAARFQDMIES